jgi:bile acid:Na+ symporter, BASS family
MKFAVLRAVGLLLAFSAGSCLPFLHAYSWLIRFGLIYMLFVVFLRIEPSRKMLHWSQFFSVAFNIFFAIALWQLFLCAGQEELARVAFFTAITPTATAAAVIVSLVGGNVTYTVTTFMLSTLCITCALPFLIPIVVGNPTPGLAQHVLLRVLSVTLLPLLAALLLRHRSKPTALKLGEKLSLSTFYVWIGLVVLIAAQARHFLDEKAQFPWVLLGTIALLSLAICATNFLVGYLLGRPRYGLECSQALGQKNNSYAVDLALTYTTPLVALGPTIYVLWHNLWNAWQLYRHDKRVLSQKHG